MPLIVSIFLIACASIGKALIVVAAGVLLERRGALTHEVRQGLSKAAASVLVPCLLIDKLSGVVTPAVLATAWPILPFGLIYVTIGCAFGALVGLGAPQNIRRPVVAACAFANSQAMPIILIDVIGPELFGDDGSDLGISYIGLYMIVYLLLQWTVGAALLDVPLLSVGGGSTQMVGPMNGHKNGSSSDAIELPEVEEAPAMEEGGSSRQSRREERRDAAGVSTLLDQTAAPRPSAGRVVLAVLRRVASPPIYGIAIGVTIGLVPPLRSLLVEPHAPLAFVRQAISLLGDASIPLNTMLLGASLSHGPTWSAVPKRVVAGVVLTKLALLPLAALLVAFILTRALTNIPPLLLLVILMESATPTANNLMMMTELAGGKASQMMATVLFAQYLFAPILLTASLTAFMAFVQS